MINSAYQRIFCQLSDLIMYAVIETGGKQHKVEEGQTLLIDLISDDKKKITFDNVLLYSDDKTVEIGQPYLSNVKVTAKIIDEVKGTKLSILRFRRRKHSMRKQGHRAKYTKIEIDKIKHKIIYHLSHLNTLFYILCLYLFNIHSTIV